MRNVSPFSKASSLFVLLALWAACSGNPTAVPAAFRTADGVGFDTTVWCTQRASVIVFLSPECPLCQNYALTIRQLQDTFASQQVRFFGVIADERFTNKTVLSFQQQFGMNIPLVRDSLKLLTHRFGATVTPEAFLLDAKGEIRYSGRIDNWMYEVGRKRTLVTEHDLDYAIRALLTDAKFKSHHTQAIGCFIE